MNEFLPRSRHTAWYVAVLLAIAAASGCKKGGGEIDVRGHVAYRGQPLKSARITFFPVAGRPVSAEVTDGEYQTRVPSNDYIVTVNVGTPLPPGFKEGDPLPPPTKLLLPDEYTARAKSTLKAAVRSDQSEAIDFDLK